MINKKKVDYHESICKIGKEKKHSPHDNKILLLNIIIIKWYYYV